MATNRNTERLRYRYGLCLNENCEKGKSKEIQEIPARKELVCAECGKPLRECPPPKKGGKTKLIATIVGIVLLLAIVGGIIAISSNHAEEPQNETIATVSVDSDSIKKAEALKQQEIKDSLSALATSEKEKETVEEKPVVTPAPTPTPQPVQVSTPAPKPAATSGTTNLGYATFKGSWPNDVNGRMIFNTSHLIDSRDPKGRMAEPGDYVIGEFSDGHLVQGIWYGSDNQVKGSVIIGK